MPKIRDKHLVRQQKPVMTLAPKTMPLTNGNRIVNLLPAPAPPSGTHVNVLRPAASGADGVRFHTVESAVAGAGGKLQTITNKRSSGERRQKVPTSTPSEPKPMPMRYVTAEEAVKFSKALGRIPTKQPTRRSEDISSERDTRFYRIYDRRDGSVRLQPVDPIPVILPAPVVRSNQETEPVVASQPSGGGQVITVPLASHSPDGVGNGCTMSYTLDPSTTDVGPRNSNRHFTAPEPVATSGTPGTQQETAQGPTTPSASVSQFSHEDSWFFPEAGAVGVLDEGHVNVASVGNPTQLLTTSTPPDFETFPESSVVEPVSFHPVIYGNVDEGAEMVQPEPEMGFPERNNVAFSSYLNQQDPSQLPPFADTFLNEWNYASEQPVTSEGYPGQTMTSNWEGQLTGGNNEAHVTSSFDEGNSTNDNYSELTSGSFGCQLTSGNFGDQLALGNFGGQLTSSNFGDQLASGNFGGQLTSGCSEGEITTSNYDVAQMRTDNHKEQTTSGFYDGQVTANHGGEVTGNFDSPVVGNRDDPASTGDFLEQLTLEELFFTTPSGSGNGGHQVFAAQNEQAQVDWQNSTSIPEKCTATTEMTELDALLTQTSNSDNGANDSWTILETVGDEVDLASALFSHVSSTTSSDGVEQQSDAAGTPQDSHDATSFHESCFPSQAEGRLDEGGAVGGAWDPEFDSLFQELLNPAGSVANDVSSPNGASFAASSPPVAFENSGEKFFEDQPPYGQGYPSTFDGEGQQQAGQQILLSVNFENEHTGNHQMTSPGGSENQVVPLPAESTKTTMHSYGGNEDYPWKPHQDGIHWVHQAEPTSSLNQRASPDGMEGAIFRESTVSVIGLAEQNFQGTATSAYGSEEVLGGGIVQLRTPTVGRTTKRTTVPVGVKNVPIDPALLSRKISDRGSRKPIETVKYLRIISSDSATKGEIVVKALEDRDHESLRTSTCSVAACESLPEKMKKSQIVVTMSTVQTTASLASKTEHLAVKRAQTATMTQTASGNDAPDSKRRAIVIGQPAVVQTKTVKSKSVETYLQSTVEAFVVFDLETCSLDITSEILEISAWCGLGETKRFQIYSVPKGRINVCATQVHRLSRLGGALLREGKPVPAVSVPEALEAFVSWLEKEARRSSPLLVAHDCKRFYARVLITNIYLRASDDVKARFAALRIRFGDSLLLFRRIFPASNSLKLAYVFNLVFGREVEKAHRASTDVTKLVELLTHPLVRAQDFRPCVFTAQSLMRPLGLLETNKPRTTSK